MLNEFTGYEKKVLRFLKKCALLKKKIYKFHSSTSYINRKLNFYFSLFMSYDIFFFL